MTHFMRLLAGLSLGFVGSFSAHAVPDLTGTYDVGTLTPLERPEAFGENKYLTQQQADNIAKRMAGAMQADAAPADPNRAAPPAGKAVGGYNLFWVDPGKGAINVDGKYRTSLITQPANGRRPPMTEYGAQRLQGFLDAWRIVWRNPDPTASITSGVAWWLDNSDPIGPYDNIEQRPLAERCILGSRSTAGPPLLPNFYNNHKRIVQTADHIMILTEMNHDARIVRLNAQHRPEGFDTWLGDSIGHWDGDTLVVETANFSETPALSGADEHLRVTETFTKTANGDLHYTFEVDNPTIWSQPWSGDYPWRSTPEDKVYEYACHEGNYALGNIMRGARILEADRTKSAGSAGSR